MLFMYSHARVLVALMGPEGPAPVLECLTAGGSVVVVAGRARQVAVGAVGSVGAV